MFQLSHAYMTTGKTIALTVWTFVSKVTSPLFNTLSRFVRAFLPKSKHLLISWLQSLFAVILEPKITWSFKQVIPRELPICRRESAMPSATTRGSTEHDLLHIGAAIPGAPGWSCRISVPAGGGARAGARAHPESAAAAAAKSLQSCPTLCDPTDCSLPGSSIHVLVFP